MTRWDCDVKLWRGVPCSFPAFYGWPFSDFDIVLSSTASLRYVSCRLCHKWIPESSRYHACSQPMRPDPEAPRRPLEAAADVVFLPPDDEEGRDDETPGEEKRVYVISTEQNSDSHMCSLCTDRMHLQYLHDIEEWVFMDCVEHEGLPIHAFCHEAVFGTGTTGTSTTSRSSDEPIS